MMSERERLSDEELNELEQTAQDADRIRPGRWIPWANDVWIEGESPRTGEFPVVTAKDTGTYSIKRVRHIAAANPQTVLAMIEELRWRRACMAGMTVLSAEQWDELMEDDE